MEVAKTAGPYGVGKLLQEARIQLPVLLLNGHHALPGFRGPERLPGRSRLAVQLRLARMLGCPVCVGLFPGLARRAGFSEEAVHSALAGRPDGLTERQYGAVSWAEAILAAQGEPPLEIPEAAQALSQAQRDHLHWMMRLELLVHATGLMFLPHRLVEQAHRG